ncbi:hypothetical protein BH09PLA1_BH09PLA1_26560 [soil metagenome]
MSERTSNRRGKLLVIGLLAVATVAAIVGIWKRGLRPISPDAKEAATQAS